MEIFVWTKTEGGKCVWEVRRHKQARRSGLSRLFRSQAAAAAQAAAASFHRRANGKMRAKPTYEKVLNLRKIISHRIF